MQHTPSLVPTPQVRHAHRSSRGVLAVAVGAWRDARARRRHEAALRRAFGDFRALHAAWAEACFDLHLLRHGGAEAVAAGDAEALALAWCAQFRYRDMRRRERDLRLVTPVAASFLALWAAHRPAPHAARSTAPSN